MSVTRTSNNRWRARVKSGRTPVASRTFDRKGDAETWVAAQKRALDLGDFVDPKAGRLTVRDVITDWMTARENSVASSTHREEGYALAALPVAFLNRPLNAVRAADLDSLYGQLLSGRARSTVSRLRNTLSSLFAWAVSQRMISKNPVLDSRVPRGSGEVAVREVWPFNLDELLEVTEVIRARSGDQNADIALTLGLTGLRWGELVALRVRDVQMVPRAAFRVSRSKPDNEPVRFTTKGGKARTVPLPQNVAGVIAPRLVGRDPDAPLFANSSGGFLNGGNWKRAVHWKEISRGRRVHDLRHTAATLWLANGVDLKTAQTWLGHSTAKLTADTYAHWLGTDSDNAAVARMDLVLAQQGDAGGTLARIG